MDTRVGDKNCSFQKHSFNYFQSKHVMTRNLPLCKEGSLRNNLRHFRIFFMLHFKVMYYLKLVAKVQNFFSLIQDEFKIFFIVFFAMPYNIVGFHLLVLSSIYNSLMLKRHHNYKVELP